MFKSTCDPATTQLKTCLPQTSFRSKSHMYIHTYISKKVRQIAFQVFQIANITQVAIFVVQIVRTGRQSYFNILNLAQHSRISFIPKMMIKLGKIVSFDQFYGMASLQEREIFSIRIFNVHCLHPYAQFFTGPRPLVHWNPLQRKLFLKPLQSKNFS